MTGTERWQEVDRLFAGALEKPTAERQAFLARECGDDVDLRASIERLLAADEQAATFLEPLVGLAIANGGPEPARIARRRR